MKKIVILVVFLMFLKPILPVLDYVINYEYITKVLCVNKQKPALKCNGKCHLMKELAKASEDEKPLNSDKKDNSKHEVEILFFQEVNSLFTYQIYFQDKVSICDFYKNLYFREVSCSVFHPPTLIS